MKFPLHLQLCIQLARVDLQDAACIGGAARGARAGARRLLQGLALGVQLAKLLLDLRRDGSAAAVSPGMAGRGGLFLGLVLAPI